MVFSLETSSSRYTSSVAIHRIGGTPIATSVDIAEILKIIVMPIQNQT